MPALESTEIGSNCQCSRNRSLFVFGPNGRCCFLDEVGAYHAHVFVFEVMAVVEETFWILNSWAEGENFQAAQGSKEGKARAIGGGFCS